MTDGDSFYMLELWAMTLSQWKQSVVRYGSHCSPLMSLSQHRTLPQKGFAVCQGDSRRCRCRTPCATLAADATCRGCQSRDRDDTICCPSCPVEPHVFLTACSWCYTRTLCNMCQKLCWNIFLTKRIAEDKLQLQWIHVRTVAEDGSQVHDSWTTL